MESQTEQKLNRLYPGFETGLVHSILEEASLRMVPAGTELMRPGQFIRSTMLLLEGLVKVYREDGEGNEFFMYHLQPGDACALSMTCMIGRETSNIAAKTVQDSELIQIPLEKMDEWMSRYKSWYHFVVKTYRNRFEDLLQTLDSIAFRNMDERLEFYLKRHYQTQHSKIITMTHQEIAQDLNSSREVISRLLKKMAERGKVKLHRFHIEILNV